MKTNFIPINEKAYLVVDLQKGRKEAIDAIVKELDRLESIIKDYEIGMRQVMDKYINDSYKSPEVYKP